jgi:catechol 2,3-dioxygenase-like lactoylglutathione lyase family enzyme
MDDSPLLDQLNLVASDMAATVTFYRRLGLDIADTDPALQDHHRSARMADGLDLDFDSATFPVGIMSPVDPDRRSHPDFP